MKPLTRKEFFMAKAAGQSVPDLEPITREEYFLNQIAENGGGGGLPAITEDDEGKVLTVDEGAAVWAEGGGGGGNIYLELDLDTASIDASFNELLDYYNDGKLIILKNMYDDSGTTNYEWYIMSQMQRVPDGESLTFYAYFASFPFIEGGIQTYAMIFTSTDADENMVIYE